jgi:hypothetical protein
MSSSTSDNTGFASGGVRCKLVAFCFASSSVLVDSFVLLNPPECKARKRWWSFKKSSYLLEFCKINKNSFVI